MTKQPLDSGPVLGAGPDFSFDSFNLASLLCSIIWLFVLVGEATVSIVGDAIVFVVAESDVEPKRLIVSMMEVMLVLKSGHLNKLELL